MNRLYKGLARPYQVWLIVLVFIPLLSMLLISVSNYSVGMDLANLQITLSHWNLLYENVSSTPGTFSNPFITAFTNSLTGAFFTTIISFVLGYFVAYQIKRSRVKNKLIIMTIIILPMWTNLLLRVGGFANIMLENNIIESIFGINPLGGLFGTWPGIVFALVVTYMPFMILPVYTALEKIDISLEEASLDLGLTPFKTFWKVIFPLSMKGVVTGSIMVFLPTFAGFAIPKLLGGNIYFIGNMIENRFIYTRNYAEGSLLSMVVLIIILGSLLLITRFDKEGETLL